MTVYGVVRSVLRTGLRAYFSEIEVRGAERVPPDGPVVVVANHHDSMIDPFLIIAALPRPISFLAKEPLFRMPVLGTVLRALRCIPAHRSQDPGYAKEKNESLYAASAALLAQGRALGIFPEGKSHTEPHLAEFRHGASRIAFEADRLNPGVRVQPVSIHFEETRAFRGRVLVTLGPALALDAHREAYARDPRGTIAAFTADLHARLSTMIVSAESREMLEMAELVARIRRIDGDLEEVVRRKKGLLSAEAMLRERAPVELARLKEALRRYQRMLDLLGVQDDQIARDFRAHRVAGRALRAAFIFAATLPIAALGIACNFPPYVVSWIVARMSGPSLDRQASGGFLAALFAFPAWWAALGWIQWRFAGAPALVAGLVAAPLSGAIALRWMDAWSRTVGAMLGLWNAMALPAARRKLRRMRALIGRRLDDLAVRVA